MLVEAVVVGLDVNVAVTVTWTLLAVRYGGGVYWPFAEIDPALELASPPETLQLTPAVPPELRVAVNCSTAVPDELVELQLVQFVSMVEVVGVMEKVPFEAVPELTEPPPQPATRRMMGSAVNATTRAGHFPRNGENPPPLTFLELRRRSAVTDALSLNSSSAFQKTSLAF